MQHFGVKAFEQLCEVTLPNGITQQIPLPSIAQLREIYIWNVYELGYKIKEGDIIIDIGAMVGTFSLKHARTASKIYAFEPFPASFELLRNNIARNKFGNIIAYNLALSHKKGVLKLWLHDNPGSQSVVMQGDADRFIPIKSVRLDEVDEVTKEENIDFIKIDAEGAELYILKGATGLFKPPLHLGVAAYHFEEEMEQIKKFLEEKNFEISTLDWGPFQGTRFVHAKLE